MIRVVENNVIKKHGYFEETLDLLNSLIHGYKYYNDPVYKLDKRSRKKIFIRYNARESIKILKKHSYLNNLNYLEFLRNQVYEEYVIRTLDLVRPCNKNLKFEDEKFFINYLYNFKSTDFYYDITKEMGSYAFAINSVITFLIHEEVFKKLSRYNLFVKKTYYYSLDSKYKKHILLYKKNAIKEKISKVF